jgi:M3 family oligoendopeptidase
MTFESFAYRRPDIEAMSDGFEKNLTGFEEAKALSTQNRFLNRLNEMREEFWTMYNLCYIRHTADTNDPFYEKENEYFDEHLPAYEALNNRFFRALLNAPFRPALEKKYGKQLFNLAELALKTFQPNILEDLQKENTLSTEYTKMKAQARVDFNGQTYNLSSIQPLELSDDRATRKNASNAKWQFYAGQSPKVESIFDQMVKTRHAMARKLGYKNFVEVGYARMRRSDYNPVMVANFRKQVREIIVPLAGELYERQRQRLGLDKLKFYDEEYKFPTGNPKPMGTPEQILANARSMYRELSDDTNLFFGFMMDNHLMDLVNRNGKAPGGYCTYMGQYKAPFIFSNFNGTSGDIDVLTHEAGHAFQVWSSGSRFDFDEYHWPTSDAAEIHSMSMEFFTWPWMNLFFGPDTDKYRFLHMGNGVQFLPYGVAVDEFQHVVYENPDLTPAERNAEWRRIEKIYLPHRDYDGNEFLEQGGFWQKQGHIFNSPFYYIDYTLAQICAFQFWTRDRSDHAGAWYDYVRLCRAGGSKSFLDLVRLANLRSPFDDGCVDSVVGEIRSFLESVDDTHF